MKNDAKGLRWNNWKYIMSFSVIILICLWILQFALFGAFYNQMKIRELSKIGDEIYEYVEDTATSLIDVQRFTYGYNIQMMIVDSDGNSIIRMDSFGRESTIMEKSFIQLPDVSQIKESHTYIEEINDISIGVYIHKIETTQSPLYLVITSSIPTYDSTQSVLTIQYTIITIIIIGLSIVVAHFISNKMSKPIIQLTRSAKQLANGNYDVVFSGNDYAEIAELSNTLTYATTELSKTDAYRKELMANVSHDLKTPLTIIKFYSEMLKDFSGEDASKREEHCNIIIKEVDGLTDMVSELLELSKLEANTITMHSQPLNLSSLSLEAIYHFETFCEKEGYQLLSTIEEDLIVQADSRYIKRVMYNLISNAINYTGEDKKVSISLFQENGKVYFEVSDSGKGIPEEEKQNIWDRYYKSSDVDHTRAVIGTGLGLSIVKNILEAHDAQYGVKNNETGVGSTFWFVLHKDTNT